MLQRALKAGVIGRRYIEPGELFEHAERMNWATPVGEAPASKPAGGKKRAAPAEPAEAPASAEAGPDADLI